MIKTFIIITCIVFTSFYNVFATPFTNLGIGNFRALSNGFQIEADFNNDGYLDVLMSGSDGTYNYTEIYLNNKNLTFSLLPTAIPALSDVTADVADFNGDGFVDIAISGIDTTIHHYKYCKIFKNNGDNTFTAISAPVENVALGAVLWADFNNDGILDLFTCGINQSGTYVSHIYKGVGNSSFTQLNVTVPAIISGGATVIDFDNDSYTDIALTGINSSGQTQSYLYKNKGNFTFASVNSGFESIINGNIVAADINADGYTDVIITGRNQNNYKVSALYYNNKGVFIRSATASLDSLSSSNIKVGDFDNDGYLDILLTGTDNSGLYNATLYFNNHNNTFTKNSTLFPALTSASASAADFDNDGDLDILISGETYTGNLTNLFRNNSATANLDPQAPSNLLSVSKDDSVSISWARAIDNETLQKGLSYNFYLGSASGKYDFIAPMSVLSTGKRKVAKTGNLFQDTARILKRLPEGKYYWSVQSVDDNFEGSAFAAEQSFTICHNLFVGQDTSVCKGDTVTLKAGAGTDVVNWYSLATGLLATHVQQIQYSVKATDRIVVELTNKWGCTLYDTIDLKTLPLPVVNLGRDTSICYQSPILLNAGSGWKKISWFNGSNQLIADDTAKYRYVVNANATFMVAVTDKNSCKNRDTINISKYNLPVFTLGSDKSVCFGDTAKLSINMAFPQMNWCKFNSNTILSSLQTYNYRVTGTDTLLTNATDLNGCKNNDTIVVTMLELPDVKLPKDTSVCYGQDIIIPINKKFPHITWTSANIGHSVLDTTAISFTVKVSDYVKAFVTDGFGCRNADSVEVAKLNLPAFNIGPDTANCVGSQILFNAGPGWKQVNWYQTGDILLLVNNWFYEHHISQNTKIWAKVTDYYNCVNYDTANIIAYPLPVFSLGNDTSLCKNDSIRLITKNEYQNTTWKSALDGVLLSGANVFNYEVKQNDIISAEVTDVNSCKSIDTIKIGMLQLPILNLGTDTTICYNSKLVLNAGSNWKSVTWVNESANNVINTGAIYDHTFIASDTFVVHIVDNNGCKGGDTFAVKVAVLPKFSLGSDTAICIGKAISLFVNNSDYDVKWYSNTLGFLKSGNALLQFKSQITDTIIAIASSAFSCFGSDTVVIKVNSLPRIDAGTDSLVCYGSTISLGSKNTAMGNGPFKYSWSSMPQLSDSVSSNPVVNPEKDIEYYLRVTDSNGCASSDSVRITVNPRNIFQLRDQIALCKGEKVVLGQSPIIKGSKFPYRFQWSPDSTLSASDIETPIASPSITNTYRLVASTWLCPADTTFVKLLVRNLPKPYISPTLTIGNNESIQLYAEGGASYHWSPADNLNKSDVADPIASPKVTTLYTVDVTDSFGCTSSDTVRVIIRNEIFVPEVFTPNGDGKNDVFKVYGFGIVDLSLAIFDRYNNKVYESLDANEITTTGWDGTYKGKALEQGIYRWIIDGRFADGQKILVNGKDNGVVSLIK